MLKLCVSILVLCLVASSLVWEVKANAAKEPRRALRHRLVEDVQDIHERFGDLLKSNADVLSDNLAAFADAEIQVRNDVDTKAVGGEGKSIGNTFHQNDHNKLKEMHKQLEEPIFSLPFSILPNAAAEGWTDLENILPPILSGMSFPFVHEDAHRFNHIGALNHDHGHHHHHHSTAMTSTLPTSTLPTSTRPGEGVLEAHAANHHTPLDASPNCKPLSWMHNGDAEAASPKCLPLSWMHHGKDHPSEKTQAMQAEVTELLPPFSLPFSLPLHEDGNIELEEFHAPLVAMNDNTHTTAEPEVIGPDCNCLPGFDRDCCTIPRPLCNPGKIDCNIPWYLLFPPVCGCDGRTYANWCVALFENCVKCWEPGPCAMSYY